MTVCHEQLIKDIGSACGKKSVDYRAFVDDKTGTIIPSASGSG